MDELRKDLIVFWRKLGTLLAGGVPILRALKVIEEESRHPEMKTAAAAIRLAIEKGKSLSECLVEAPRCFSLSVRELIRVGELTGRLDAVCADIVRGLEDDSLPVGDSTPPSAAAVTAELSGLPVIRLVNALIFEAFERRASDIHLEMRADGLNIRYRVDGVLQPANLKIPDGQKPEEVLAHVKVMAGLNTTERRRPQDGRIQLAVKSKPLDLRVSCIPYVSGECIVLRLLDKSNICLDIEKLDFTPPNLATVRRWLGRPNGIIIVTGPTGSGKTTTLYAMLQTLNRPENKIVTVEDPVEYIIPGINHQAVRPEIGLTFASALRPELRQDPDVIMVGEIRDLDTAQLIIHVALTGHLVLTTLHTNDACGAIQRLIDMGVDPFLINATLIGVVAQRLLRRICPKCKREVGPQEWMKNALAEHPGMKVFMGQGCEHCKQTRYRGRTAFHELLEMNDDIRRWVTRDMDAPKLRAQAVRSGMIPMREAGLAMAAEGVTSIEEVLRMLAM